METETSELPRRNPKGGRPKKADGSLKDSHVIVRVSLVEKAAIQDAAAAAGVSASEYLRSLALDAPLPAVARSADPALLAELNAIGNNLNQLARSVHRGSAFQAYWKEIGKELEAVLAKAARLT